MENKKITRFDFLKLRDPDQGCREVVQIRKYFDGWEAGAPPSDLEIKPANYDYERVLSWAEQNGFTVRRWPGGARAFLGKPRSVRTEGQIKSLRRMLEEENYRNRGISPRGIQIHAVDLAYDL